MKRYPKYKDSGVPWLGQVPAHWPLVRIGSQTALRSEKGSDKDFTPLSVTKLGVVPQLETAAKTDDGDNRKIVRKGDFVINGRSDRKGSSGVSAIDGSVSLINITIKLGAGFYPRFAHHLFRSYAFQEEFYRWGKGIVADLWSTNYWDLKRIMCAMPTLEEQESIAKFLDAELVEMDSAISSQERMIELLKERRSAIITQAVTKGLDPKAKMKDSGIPWLGQVPAHWVVVKLNRLIDSCRPITYGIVQAGEDYPGGVKYIRPVDMTESSGVKDETTLKTTSPQIALQYKRSEVKAGDVVFSIGPSYGKVMIVPPSLEGANLTQGTARLAFSSAVSKEFLCHALRSSASKAQWDMSVGGATFGGLNLKPLSRTMLALPPLSEQVRIAGFLDGIMNRLDDAISSQERMIELLKERRSAIITQAVTGQIDVR